jgi:HD-GYP domain-containing protein (c-di-GMP phosphodiesterase class II)
VAELASRLATACGWDLVEALRLHDAALVHDVGKIGVPDSILLAPRRLRPKASRR